MNLNSSDFISISWITAFNADQEDRETEFFEHLDCAYIAGRTAGKSIPLSTTLSHDGVETVKAIVRNLYFESKTLQAHISKSTLGICTEIITTFSNSSG